MGPRRLSAALAVEMRRRYDQGERQADLARAFGISRSIASRIVKGTVWPNLKAGVLTRIDGAWWLDNDGAGCDFEGLIPLGWEGKRVTVHHSDDAVTVRLVARRQ